MSHAQIIKDVLASSYELSRAELIQRSGLTRAQVRKALPMLLKTKEVERWVDEQGVEYLSEGKEDKQCVEQSQGRYVDKEEFNRLLEHKNITGWYEGYAEGRRDAWKEVERAIGTMIRDFLGLGARDGVDEDE